MRKVDLPLAQALQALVSLVAFLPALVVASLSIQELALALD